MLAVKDEAMSRNIVDLEELVLKCQSVQSRAYISEAVDCYQAGALSRLHSLHLDCCPISTS